MAKRKRKLRVGRIRRFLTLVLIVSFACFLVLTKLTDKGTTEVSYLASANEQIVLYDSEFKETSKLVRGIEVSKYKTKVSNEGLTYNKIKYQGKNYLILENQLSETKDNVVLETEKYVRTSLTVYNADDTILGSLKKGDKVNITGYTSLKEDGSVDKYKVKYKDTEGLVYSKYLVKKEEESLKNYDEEGTYKVHLARTDTFLGAGDAGTLDYYPYEKVSFENNVMPDETRTLYLTGTTTTMNKIDEYIQLAKESNINAFVVDIKDGTTSYESPIDKKYSPNNFKYSYCYFDVYGKAIKKLKDAGFYVIGRISVFKDSYYAQDNPSDAIVDGSGNLLKHNGAYWPSAYQRSVWQYNVELAKEAVKEFGFNEIQFDYCRFPDGIYNKEKAGQANLRNEYNETKSEAIQQFLFYATDQIHELGAYVSVDVFGESAYTYVTGYGQYWPAISNIVDVISAMPYPDHFNAHEFGISEVVWTVPYKVLDQWGYRASLRQKEIPTPAKVRTWIQAYNAIHFPYNTYGPTEIENQIKALYTNGLTDGYITWNGLANIDKYREISSAFKKDYR